YFAPSVSIQEPINDGVMECTSEPLFQYFSNLRSYDNLTFLSHSNKRRYEFGLFFPGHVRVSSPPTSYSFNHVRPKAVVIRDQIMNGAFSHSHMEGYFLGCYRIDGCMQNDQPLLAGPRSLGLSYSLSDLLLRKMPKCPGHPSHDGLLQKDGGTSYHIPNMNASWYQRKGEGDAEPSGCGRIPGRGDAPIGRSGAPQAYFMPLQPQDCELFVRIVLGSELILRIPV